MIGGTVVVMVALAQAPVSSCAVADEAGYGTTKERAIQVGGGAMYVASRERRYLDSLRGPMGEPLQYKRTGSLPLDKEGRTILDAFEITYPGLDKPVVFYLDAYHFDDSLGAPHGFICAVPIGLPPPPPDPMLAAEALIELAIEQGASRDLAPISLDADGSNRHGVLLDHFRLIARAARAASEAGAPLDPQKPALELMRARMVVVAYPLRCGAADAVPPGSIELVAAQGQPPRRDGEPATGDAIARLLPGMTLPPGSMAAAYFIDRPRASDTIRIAYPDSACGTSTTVTLPMTYANAKPVKTPAPTFPAGADEKVAIDRPIRLQALIDLDGAARHISYVGGPPALVDRAIETVRSWTAEQARLNGSPVVTPVLLQVRFEKQGAKGANGSKGAKGAGAKGAKGAGAKGAGADGARDPELHAQHPHR
jgi:hypothetical protein